MSVFIYNCVYKCIYKCMFLCLQKQPFFITK